MTDSGSGGVGFAAYRIWGSAGWASSSLFLGVLLSQIGVSNLFRLSAFVYLAVMLLMWKATEEPPFDDPVSEAIDVPAQNAGLLAFGLPFVLLVAAVCVFSFADQAGFAYFAVFLKRDLGLSDLHFGWVLASQGIFGIPMMLGLGRVADRVERKHLLLAAGFVIAGFRWILLPFLTDVAAIISLQLLHSAGVACLHSVTVSYVSDLVARQHRGSALGTLWSAVSAGAVLAPAMAGQMADAFGLKVVFQVLGVIGMLGGSILLWPSRPTSSPAAMRE